MGWLALDLFPDKHVTLEGPAGAIRLGVDQLPRLGETRAYRVDAAHSATVRRVEQTDPRHPTRPRYLFDAPRAVSITRSDARCKTRRAS